MTPARAIAIILLAASIIFMFTLGVTMVAVSAQSLVPVHSGADSPALDFGTPKDGVTVPKPSFPMQPEIRRR